MIRTFETCSFRADLKFPHKFVKEDLTRKFGEALYMELEKIAQERGK
jgi:hypothetical protein